MSEDRSGKNGSVDVAHGLLPQGWVWASVEELLAGPTCNGISVKGSDSPPGVPALRLSAMTDRGFDYTERRYIPISPEVYEELAVRAGDLFVSRGNGSLRLLGRSTLAQEPPENIVFPDTMIRLRFGGGPTLARYVNHIWGSRVVRFQIESKARTTAGIYKISQPDVRGFRLPVPPLAEQGRIVERIEELLTDLDAGIAALERVRSKLRRYRASVLKEAISGGLTADWRADHPEIEPATDLLRRILDERRRRWEEAQLAKFTEVGKEPPKNWRSKYPEPAQPPSGGLFELPSGWCWTTLDAIAELTGGITKGQKRPGRGSLREVPYLRVANVQRGRLDLEEIKTIEATEGEIEFLKLQPGDILFNEGGDRDKLGRGWVWKSEIPECIHQNHVFRARLIEPTIVPELVSHHGNTFGQGWFMRTGKQSVNLASINLTVLKQFPVPLAPSDEQTQILSEIEQRLSVVDQALLQVDANLRRSARLRQAILKQAFEGRLVAQDPDDEPADRLLERIRSERDKAGVGSNGGRVPRNRFARRRAEELPLFEQGDCDQMEPRAIEPPRRPC